MRDFEHNEIFRPEKNTGKKMNALADLSLLSYGEVSAFLVLLKTRNSRLLTGRLICLS